MRYFLLTTLCLGSCLALTLPACGGGDRVSKETKCSDGSDNDNDGMVDCNDGDCRGKDGCGNGSCGNGTLDTGESCDGTNLNGKTCVTQGFDTGTLACASNCTSFVTSGCSNLGGSENCTNGVDDDGDQAVDCADSSCASHSSCGSSASCSAAAVVAIPSTTNGANTGGPSNVGDISCFDPPTAGASNGPAAFHRINPAESGTLRLTLDSTADLMIVVYETCGTGDVACQDLVAGGSPEELDVDVTSGTPIYVAIVGYESTDVGAYVLDVDWLRETACADFNDDDGDGLYDCEDPDCAGASCTPGAGVLGAACAANNECALINGGGPLCVTEEYSGFPSGFCTRVCSENADCGASGLCTSFGVCMIKCDASADCRAGTDCYPSDEPYCGPACANNGQCTGGRFCGEGDGSCYPAGDENCGAAGDEDEDGFENCEDTDCTVACQPSGLTETELNNFVGQADDYTSGFTGASSPAGNDVDYVRFNVGAAGSVTVATTDASCASGGLDTGIIVYGPNLVALGNNDDISTSNRCSSLTFSATQSGTHYVAVVGYDTTVKTYTLSVTP